MQLWRLTATDLAALIRSGQVSAREAARDALDRLDAVNGRINADYLTNRTTIPIPMRRGQTLFFGGHLIHGSGPNNSASRSRRTFIGHYVSRATTSFSKFYHPLLDMQGNQVDWIPMSDRGGPCG